MIMNKNQLKNNLHVGTTIERVYNLQNANKIPVGSKGVVVHVQSNAFRIKWDCLDNPTWCYYDNIDVKEDEIIYYDYVPESRVEEAENTIRERGLDIELIPLEGKEYERMNKGSNYNYTHKYIIMKNIVKC